MSSLQDFVTEFGLQADFDAWLGLKVNELTEQAFLDSLQGKSGKSNIFGMYDQFWISIFGEYAEDNENLLIGRFIFPEEIYIEPSPLKAHVMTVEPSPLYDDFTINMTCGQQFDARKIGHYTESGRPLSNIDLEYSQGKIKSIAGIDPTDRIYIRKGSLLNFEWDSDNLPVDKSVIALTLQAYKRKFIPTDTAIIQGISGLWYVSVSGIGSLKGYNGVLDNNGNNVESALPFSVENLTNITRYSESIGMFQRDISVGSDYLPLLNEIPTNMTIRNHSNTDRIITLIPVNEADTNNNGALEDSNLLPSNAYMDGNKLIIELAANQD